MTIRWKLALILALPLVALAFVVMRGVAQERDAVADNERARDVIRLALLGRDVMGRAELEYGLELSGGYPGAIRDLRDRTRIAIDAFQTVVASGAADRLGPAFVEKVSDVEGAIAALETAERSSGDGTGSPATVDELGRTVVALTLEGARSVDHDAELAQRLLGYAALLEAQQQLGGLFTRVAATSEVDALTESFRLDLAQGRGALDAATAAFAGSATPAELAELDRAVPEQALDELFGGNLIDRQAFVDAASRGIEAVDALSASVAGRLDARAAQKQENAAGDAFEFLAVGGGAFVVGLVALLFALRLSGRMVRRLRHLSGAAEDLSQRRLPALVDGLRSGTADVTSETPIGLGDLGKDEIGALGRSFEAVHGTVLEVAREQARILEQGISDIFVKLARRNQALVERQITLLDQLERDEEDADVLADLFRIDHIATRIRRNAESLLVLAGSDSARKWTEPLALADVLQAATAEIEDYERIRVAHVDDVRVRPHAAVDLAHLLAELLENAVRFSPPGTTVEIATRRRGGFCQVAVVDHGLGMTDQQLADANRLLAEPPVAGLELSRTLGHYVVARLAKRHGVDVQLGAGTVDGVVAVVSLPAALLLEADEPQTNERQAPATPVRKPAPEPAAALAQLPQRTLPRREEARPAAAAAPAASGGDNVDALPAREPAAVAPAPLPAAAAPSFDPLPTRLRPPSPKAPPAEGRALPRRGSTVVLSATPGPGAGVAASRRSPQERRDLIHRFRRGFESGLRRPAEHPNGDTEVSAE
jgi:signal transduction histidine kinase